jgi:2-polyprenyl-3-methyl-5-hydroxy-6-metoxy-1,4-benzoquinol methylase
MSPDRASPCQVCGTERNARVILILPDCRFARCGRCGLVYLDGERTLEEQHRIYQDDQFEDGGYMGMVDIERIAAEQVESAGSILRRAGTSLDALPRELPVLDVGCARGHFLRRLAELTGRRNLVGIDASASMARHGRDDFGLDLRAQPIESAELPGAAFGLITLWDVLEHLAFPRQALERVLALLAPGGWAVVEVPSERTLFRMLTRLGHRLTGGGLSGPVRALYHPSHLSYFTPRSLRMLATSLGAENVTLVTKEAHVTRFGLARYRPPARLAIRLTAGADRLLGMQAKLLCAFRRPAS